MCVCVCVRVRACVCGVCVCVWTIDATVTHHLCLILFIEILADVFEITHLLGEWVGIKQYFDV